MRLPEPVLSVLQKLNGAGHSAYIVGGAVRDSLMRRPVEDYDICTSARPEEVEALFSDAVTAGAGRRFGTVVVPIDGSGAVEVTTFRSDGEYGDGRHPETVTFGHSLTEDFARRDFTVNAIAWHPDEGYIDPFGGMRDIKNHVIRAVGDPDLRFREDALRILRALRFSATLHFRIAKKTERSLLAERPRVAALSAERMRDELSKFLLADAAGQALLRYKQVWFEVVPELRACDRFQGRSRYHSMDLLPHIAKTVDEVKPTLLLRVTALLHDVGKPYTYRDGRFPGHMEKGAEMAEEILSRLRYPKKLIADAVLLIRYHDYRVDETLPNAKWALNAVGERLIFDLIEHKRADTLAHAPAIISGRMRELDAFEWNARHVLRSGECYAVSMLAVTGDDLLDEGLSGESVGEALRFLLKGVIEEELPNNRDALLARLRDFSAKDKRGIR